MWDRDFFASNDIIGEAQLDLKELFQDVIESGKQMSLNKKYHDAYYKDHTGGIKLNFKDDDSFWVPCKAV